MQWRIRVPALGLDLEVSPRMQDQELRLSPIAYWEGAITATGSHGKRRLSGSGYLEMTGYAGAVAGLQAGD
jgi:predicted secreted hydrolase